MAAAAAAADAAADAEDTANTPAADDNNEARMRYLRERGITIETPESRKADAALAASMRRLRASDPGTRTFRFVRIPADSSMPLSEEEAVVYADPARGPPGDQLLHLLKPRYAAGQVDATALRRSIGATHLGNAEAAGALKGVTPAAIAADGGAVEAFRISDDVNLYLDAVGALKQLAPNPRASALAARCGFGENVPFFGDMFVGRLGIPPGSSGGGSAQLLRTNVDFTLEDMVPGPGTWLEDAAAQNLRRQAQEVAQGRTGGVSAEELAEKGGEGDGSTWSQTKADVEVSVPLPAGVRGKQCKVKFGTRRLQVAVPGLDAPLIFDPLYAKVRADDCAWTVSDGMLVVTMEKMRVGEVWPSVK